MNNQDLLLDFFAAENRRDWGAYRSFLDAEVIWVLHTDKISEIRGIDAYMERIMAAYRDSGDTFAVEKLYGGAERIAAVLVNSAGVRSCDIFAFSNGKIVREDEFIV